MAKKAASGRTVEFDETVSEAKRLRHMSPQGATAIALCGTVAPGQKSPTAITGQKG